MGTEDNREFKDARKWTAAIRKFAQQNPGYQWISSDLPPLIGFQACEPSDQYRVRAVHFLAALSVVRDNQKIKEQMQTPDLRQGFARELNRKYHDAGERHRVWQAT